MAALTTFAELMARASATVFSQLCTNALEKAQQQHQLNIQQSQQQAIAFPMIPALMASISIPTGMPCNNNNISLSSQQQIITTENNLNNNEQKQQQKQLLLEEEENKNCCFSINKTNNINRKRKRTTTKNNVETTKTSKTIQQKQTKQTTTTVEKSQQQQQINNNKQQIIPLNQQELLQKQSFKCCNNNNSTSSSSPPLLVNNTSRISSPDSSTSIVVHKGRKLKLYAAEEKTDIIDYAKCIGNRAAGREFNVAESSIREWRKNEDKIRKQAETTIGCTQYFEKNQTQIIERIDDELVKMLNSKDKRCTTWYGIAEQVNLLWSSIAKETNIENNEMKITMGWVSRFMRRNENRVPKVTPPIIATSYSSNSTTNGNISSSSTASTNNNIRKSNCTTTNSIQPIETRAKAKSKAAATKINNKQENNFTTNINTKNELLTTSSRRKRFRPIRVDADCATLITSAAIIKQEQLQQNCEY